jgi:hypothetical protein
MKKSYQKLTKISRTKSKPKTSRKTNGTRKVARRKNKT